MDREIIEEIILTMADLVMENRYLREEVARLQKVEKEYYYDINERARKSEEASRNMLGAALKGIIDGKSELELISELVDYMYP